MKEEKSSVITAIDWEKVAQTVLLSRGIDEKEENELVPDKKVLYQFSAKGHELCQVLLGLQLDHPQDAASVYYRSRPFILAAGLSPEHAFAASMAKSGGFSDGRDIGVVFNMTAREGVTVLPMAGDVGSQYTPAAGWAQAIEYRRNVLEESRYEGAISVVLAGDGSVATNGFWSALTMATTLNLPLLIIIEDNGYGLSVPSDMQVPGGNIATNLHSFKNLTIFDGDGTRPEETAELTKRAVQHVREREGPVLLRLSVPRLCGHSFQDNQAYKESEQLEKERQRDPLVHLKQYLVPENVSEEKWKDWEQECQKQVNRAAEKAWARPDPDKGLVRRFVFAETLPDGSADLQKAGGLAVEGHRFPEPVFTPEPEKQRINVSEAIRRTIDFELQTNDKLVVFGEDVGLKGGVHGVTLGLQSRFGADRVFDTSLSEDGIIGRALGMACAGLMPVAEIQFRKYADPATEQLKNCGTVRWRTANRFACPMVVRLAGGFAKCGDPWHSESGEVFFAHLVGWQVACPSNAEDAAGLLRSAMRSNNLTLFFEHRNLYDARHARRPYPGDRYVIPFGQSKKLREGRQATLVTWGAMCRRCEEAVKETGIDAEIMDLRTIAPWDKQAVMESLQKTNRCLIVHEDTATAGFGAEISTCLSEEMFSYLDAPVQRLAVPDMPLPYNVELMNTVLPGAEKIAELLTELVEY